MGTIYLLTIKMVVPRLTHLYILFIKTCLKVSAPSALETSETWCIQKKAYQITLVCFCQNYSFPNACWVILDYNSNTRRYT